MKNGWDELWELSVSVIQWTLANGLLLCILAGLPPKHRCQWTAIFVLTMISIFERDIMIHLYTYQTEKSLKPLSSLIFCTLALHLSHFTLISRRFMVEANEKWDCPCWRASRLIQDGAKRVLLHICRQPYLSHVSCEVLCAQQQWDLAWSCALMHCIVALVFCDV